MLGFNSGLLGVRRVPTTGTATGVWLANEQVLAQRAGIWPAVAATDPDFASVSLLLHMDGTNGSTTFTDSSSNGLTVTANGNTQVSTTTPKWGTGSASFDGNTDWLSLTPATLLQFPADFTLEGWFYLNSTAQMAGGSSSSDSNTLAFRFNENQAGNLGFSLNGTTVFSSTAAGITTSTWQHVAISRSGTNTRMFVDGVQKGSTNTSWSGTFRMDIIGTFFFNGNRYAGYDFDGKIDDLRITKGVARYTANFTAPTAPFPDA
jgi:hypothetical protein